jgi:hypothetical protein
MAKKENKKSEDKKTNEKKVTNNEKHVNHEKHINYLYVIVGLLIVILALSMIKVNYDTTEMYMGIEEYDEVVEVTRDDTANPIDKEVCTQEQATFRVEGESSYKFPEGGKIVCTGVFKAWNDETTNGEWTFGYTFNVNGKDFEMDPITREIPAGFPIEFTFRKNDCKSSDKITGKYKLIQSPSTEKCEYKTVYPKITVEETVTKEREVPMEKTVVKKQSLWEMIIGANN